MLVEHSIAEDSPPVQGQQHRRPARCSHVELHPIDLSSQTEFDLLLHQRHLCGWLRSPGDLQRWHNEIKNRRKILFWITAVLPQSHPPLATQRIHRVGHCGLDYDLATPNPEWCNPDGSVLMLSSLFIDPSYRSIGAGRKAVEALEEASQRPPYGSARCSSVTLTTTSRRYHEVDGLTGRGFFSLLRTDDGHVGPGPRGASNEDWYSRLGHIKEWEGPLYPATMKDGTHGKWVAVMMRKTFVVSKQVDEDDNTDKSVAS